MVSDRISDLGLRSFKSVPTERIFASYGIIAANEFILDYSHGNVPKTSQRSVGTCSRCLRNLSPSQDAFRVSTCQYIVQIPQKQ